MSQRADRELDRLLQIARPEASPDFTDGVMARIASSDDPMPIAPAIVVPFRGRSFNGLGSFPAPRPSLFARTLVVTAPLVAMLGLVLVLGTVFSISVFSDRGTSPSVSETHRDSDTTAAAEEPKSADLQRRLLAAKDPDHAADPKTRQCSACHDLASVSSYDVLGASRANAPSHDPRMVSLPPGEPVVTALPIVAYVDLGAPGASEMLRALEAMVLRFPTQIRVEIRSTGTDPATRASLAAASYGKYWPMIECLDEHGTAATDIDACADQVGVGRDALRTGAKAPELTAMLDTSIAVARAADVTGSMIVIGDRKYPSGAHKRARELVDTAVASLQANL